ncbi:hypothetical protein PVM13_33680 [Klebsiella variicola]|nr:hypothetical protein [Klebsiella variicola]MDD9253651.1 hypothetical protein [Klebsiella variicola]
MLKLNELDLDVEADLL